MKVTEIKYVKRFNLGNFEHEEYSIAAVVEEDADVKEALNEIKDVVNATQSGEATEDGPKPEKTVSKKEEKTKTAMGRGSKKSTQSQEPEGEEDEEETSEEDEEAEESAEEESNSEDDQEDAEAEEDKKTKSKKSSGKSESGKPKRGRNKSTVYSRVDDLHKKLVGEMLDNEVPTWKKKYSENALLASKKMNGKDFLDAEGEMLEDFKKSFLRIIKGK